MNKIDCPFCGLRGAEEFHYEGDATKVRPDSETDDVSKWMDFVYQRDNPDGFHHEYWYHGAGCRSFLIVERHMRSHEVRSVRLARDGREAKS